LFIRNQPNQQILKFTNSNFFLSLIQLTPRILLRCHTPAMNDGCKSENATNDPVEHMLIIADAVGDQNTAKDEDTVANKGTDTDARDIGIVMIGPGQ
jgi:hypothetical protein